MINHSKEFIFVHCFKNAGTSMWKTLIKASKRTLFERLLLREDDVAEYLPGHSNAKSFLSLLGEEKFNEYTKFSSIRNPFDRCVSQYYFYQTKHHRDWVIKQGWTPNVHQLCTDGSFKDYVMSDLFKYHSMTDMLYINEVNVMDELIRFENLKMDWSRVQKIIGLNGFNLPHEKHNSRRKKGTYKSYYDEEAYMKVKKIVQKDLDNFNYTF